MLEPGLSASDLSKYLWMSDEHLRYLSDNRHMVGLHSYSHPTVLARMSYEEQFEEYRRNYLRIKKIFGQEPVTMSHPSNSYNDDTIDILKRLGTRCGFSANMFPKEQEGHLNPNEFEIARQDHANIIKKVGR